MLYYNKIHNNTNMRYRTGSDGEVEWSESPDSGSVERRSSMLPPPIKPFGGKLLSSISGIRRSIDKAFEDAKADSQPPKSGDAA